MRLFQRGTTIAALLSCPLPLSVFTPSAMAVGAITGSYVALGDSYTAGPGIPDVAGSSGLCDRSGHD